MLIFPLIQDTSRKIIHIDMDAFFAAVEERDNPTLKGKPVVIGNDPRLTGGRGVVATANYEARAFGIHSAMSTKEAYQRCSQAIFIKGNYDKYKKIGEQIRAIFYRYTDLVEPMSIDEAYLDVTNNKKGIHSAIKIAKLIQRDIWNELRLTCSAGVSYNKFLAKIASDYKKPCGLTVILPEDAQLFLKTLPIEKFHGVGKKTVEKLHSMSVYTGADLLKVPEMTLIDCFGKFGYDLYRKARGIHHNPVKSNRIRKSFGKEKTYTKLLYSDEDVITELSKLSKQVGQILEREGMSARVIVLKVRYSDFSTLTKRHRLEDVTHRSELIEQEAVTLFHHLDENMSGIRLLGITVTGLEKKTTKCISRVVA